MTESTSAGLLGDPDTGGDCEDGSQWALFAFGSADDASGAKQLTQIRSLSQAECNDIDVATHTLSMLTVESPYEDLGQTHREFIALVEDDAPVRTAAAFRYAADTRRRFRHWLTDFRSFDDRTTAWVARTFGDDHPAHTTFKDTLNQEYDFR